MKCSRNFYGANVSMRLSSLEISTITHNTVCNRMYPYVIRMSLVVLVRCFSHYHFVFLFLLPAYVFGINARRQWSDQSTNVVI